MCYFEGREYHSDTARVIKKFDVYVCDLGDTDDSSVSLGKKRPCVIISSDDISNPKSNKYYIAPIRTEHNMKITKETLDEIVESKREVGRLYIPLEISPDEYKFIDMSDIRPVSSRDILSYKFTIINTQIRQKINETIIEYFLSKNEFEEMIRNYILASKEELSISIQHALGIVHIPNEERSFFDNIPEGKQSKRKLTKKGEYPLGFEEYAELHLQGKMTMVEISEKIGKSYTTVHKYMRLYKEQKQKEIV